jgi:NADH dehydrogenase
MSVDNVASGQWPDLTALGIHPASVHTVAPTYLGTQGGRSSLLKARSGKPR